MEPARIVDRQIWRKSGISFGDRSIPEKTAVKPHLSKSLLEVRCLRRGA
jgi:hypothetical protein